jgi:uncharacterized protein with FMN-binding domain
MIQVTAVIYIPENDKKINRNHKKQIEITKTNEKAVAGQCDVIYLSVSGFYFVKKTANIENNHYTFIILHKVIVF